MTTTQDIPTGRGQLIELDPARRRARLDRLLDIRFRLAAVAAERRSHGLEDAGDTYLQQLAVESTIDDEFPDEYVERFADWVDQECRLSHDPNWLNEECGICQAIAQRAGLNISPPEAA